MTVQVVRPAGAGYETVLVLVLCAAIVALAGAVVFVRAAPDAAVGARADEFDARRDLSAAEQGLYADLRVAADEILFMAAAPEGGPSAAELAELGLPPFVQDASAANRGAHRWQKLERQGGGAYLGLSADVDVAGSLLLRLATGAKDGGPSPQAEHSHARAPQAANADGPAYDIWLNRRAGAAAPDSLDEAALIAAGWRPVAAQFDAGVTRQRRDTLQ